MIGLFHTGAIARVVHLIERNEEVPNDSWDELDEEFLRYEEDLNYLNIEYVKKNKMFF